MDKQTFEAGEFLNLLKDACPSLNESQEIGSEDGDKDLVAFQLQFRSGKADDHIDESCDNGS